MLFQQIATSIAAEGEETRGTRARCGPSRGSSASSCSRILLVLMFITLSYTNLGNRHSVTEEHADPHRQHPNKHDHGQGH